MEISFFYSARRSSFVEVTFQFQSGTEHGRVDEADRGHEPEDKDTLYCVYLFTQRERERERAREGGGRGRERMNGKDGG